MNACLEAKKTRKIWKFQLKCLFLHQIYTRMMKFFLKITLSFALLAGIPTMSMAAIDIVDQEPMTVVISQTTNNTLHIVNANGDMVSIYNVAGKCIKTFRVEGQDRQYELNLPKGIYIVKVGNTARRIIVK